MSFACCLIRQQTHIISDNFCFPQHSGSTNESQYYVIGAFPALLKIAYWNQYVLRSVAKDSRTRMHCSYLKNLAPMKNFIYQNFSHVLGVAFRYSKCPRPFLQQHRQITFSTYSIWITLTCQTRYWLSIWRWGFYDTVFRKTSNGRTTDELERTSKEVILDNSMHYPCVCSGLRKCVNIWVDIADGSMKIRTPNMTNTILSLYGCTSLLGRNCSHAKRQKKSRVFSYTYCITKGKEHVPVSRCALLQGCWTTARIILPFLFYSRIFHFNRPSSYV